MSNNPTVRRPALTDAETDDPLNHDSDDDVIGFADKPYPDPATVALPDTGPAEEPELQPQDIPVPRNDPVTHENENTNNTTTNNTTTNNDTNNDPPNISQQREKLKGWKSAVDGALCIFAFILPWTSSMAFSWTPYSRVSAREAPYEVYVLLRTPSTKSYLFLSPALNSFAIHRRVIAILSTIECASIFLFFISACIPPLAKLTNIGSTSRQPPGTPKPDKSISELITNLWMSFILFTPVVSGAWAWYQAAQHYGCRDDPLGPKCRVGKSLMSAIGAYRVFVV